MAEQVPLVAENAIHERPTHAPRQRQDQHHQRLGGGVTRRVRAVAAQPGIGADGGERGGADAEAQRQRRRRLRTGAVAQRRRHALAAVAHAQHGAADAQRGGVGEVDAGDAAPRRVRVEAVDAVEILGDDAAGVVADDADVGRAGVRIVEHHGVGRTAADRHRQRVEAHPLRHPAAAVEHLQHHGVAHAMASR
ncbi:MAG: hypothetical protein U0802_01885 [Candidatus Binatia bacterium]